MMASLATFVVGVLCGVLFILGLAYLGEIEDRRRL